MIGIGVLALLSFALIVVLYCEVARADRLLEDEYWSGGPPLVQRSQGAALVSLQDD